MGFSTTPITVEEAKEIINKTGNEGEVVSAGKEEYFNDMEWLKYVAKAELKDDSLTIFFTLHNADFVEYCCVKSEEMST